MAVGAFHSGAFLKSLPALHSCSGLRWKKLDSGTLRLCSEGSLAQMKHTSQSCGGPTTGSKQRGCWRVRLLESWATQEGYRMFLFWKCSYLRGFPCSWHWVQLCENIRHARNICFCLLTPPLIKILIKQIQYSGWEGRIYSMSVWVFVSCTSNCTMLSICKCFHQEGSITHNVLSPATQRQWEIA